MALIENIQRENLNAIEEAQALQRLQMEFTLSQQDIVDRVSRVRPVIANLLRLLTLEPAVRVLLEAGHIDTGSWQGAAGVAGGRAGQAAQQVAKGSLGTPD